MTLPRQASPCAVLFDLDGTLVDSAGDLLWCANELRRRRGLGPVALEVFREFVTFGTDTMLERTLGIGRDSPEHPILRRTFFDLYEAHLCVCTRLFPGARAVLDRLDGASVPWGIVTNKHARFTEPLIHTLRLEPRTGCVVCGDSAARPKPHPDPLEAAARAIGRSTSECVYVGDAEGDVVAARAAGMRSVVARFGYLPPEADPARWGADCIIDHPGELLAVLGLQSAGVEPRYGTEIPCER